jgi:deferrochelatase/peroxidase EfeB
MTAAGGLLATAPLPAVAGSSAAPETEPFWGEHQSGIATPQQRNSYFAALDLTTKKATDVVALLRSWTRAGARMAAGQPVSPIEREPDKQSYDSGEATDLPASRLTVTFGFGPGLFGKDAVDRYGIAKHRPDALVEMPRFNGDQLIEARCGGDLSVQACADDPQVAFHAVRQLVRLAYGAAALRWVQTGFLPNGPAEETPRNLMGFKDGTMNPKPPLTSVWVADEGPAWMRNGSYLVARRIRISLEHWDRTDLDFQEEVIGRHKYSGAPIGKEREFDPLDLDAVDKDGTPVIAENAHVRLAAPEANDGAEILRRAYSYNDGASFTVERWPPWRQGIMYDAGLFFIAYQRDPRTGFIRVYENMAKLDALNQYTTHVGSALFACPGGVRDGEFIGQALFDST